MVLIVAVIIVIGSYLMWLAGRLDRLQVRVESARASLDAQLVRRAAAAEAFAGATGAEGAELASSAADVLAGTENEETAESALTRAIRAALVAHPDGDASSLLDTSTRVRFARQFHNDTVHASLALRRRRLVRWLRLWGTSKAPVYFEIDDTIP